LAIQSNESPSMSATNLAQHLAAPAELGRLTITTATFGGLAVQKGLFLDGTDSLSMESGVVLATGDVLNAEQDGSGINFINGVRHRPLRDIFGGEAIDAAILTIQFECEYATLDGFSLQFVFGSNEYTQTRIDDAEEDGMVIFLNNENIALVEDNGSVVPVGVQQIHCDFPYDPSSSATFCPYYIHNAARQVNTAVKGFTVPLEARGTALNGTNILEISIADGGTGDFDSFAFLKSASLVCGPPLPMDVQGFALVSSAGTDVQSFSSDITVDYATTTFANIRVQADRSTQSLSITWRGSTECFNTDTNSDWLVLDNSDTDPNIPRHVVALGSYSLEASAFFTTDCTGASGLSQQVSITFEDSCDPSVLSLTLLDDALEDVVDFTTGLSIDVSTTTIGDIRVNVGPDCTLSVEIEWDSKIFCRNTVPGQDLLLLDGQAFDWTLGDIQLKVVPYAGIDCTGPLGATALQTQMSVGSSCTQGDITDFSLLGSPGDTVILDFDTDIVIDYADTTFHSIQVNVDESCTQSVMFDLDGELTCYNVSILDDNVIFLPSSSDPLQPLSVGQHVLTATAYAVLDCDSADLNLPTLSVNIDVQDSCALSASLVDESESEVLRFSSDISVDYRYNEFSNIRINKNPCIESVQVNFNGTVQCLSDDSWSLLDPPTNTTDGPPVAEGEYSLSVTPFQEPFCASEPDDPVSLNLTVLDTTPECGESPTIFKLYEKGKGLVKILEDGDMFCLEKFRIVAFLDPCYNDLVERIKVSLWDRRGNRHFRKRYLSPFDSRRYRATPGYRQMPLPNRVYTIFVNTFVNNTDPDGPLVKDESFTLNFLLKC